MPGSDAKKVAFLFKGGRRDRLAAADPGPREFFYGATEIAGADLIEEAELAKPPPSFWTGRIAGGVVARLTGINADSIARFSQPDVLSRLNAYDVLVATTNSQGLALAFLRAKGRLKARALFISMGVLGLKAPPWRRALYKALLRHASLAPLSKPEADFLRESLGSKQDVEYLPFGIDQEFWKPGQESGADGDYVFSVGNDWNRDYKTLINAWRPEYPPLKVVTSLPMPPTPNNIQVIAGGWRKQVLSDEEVRRLFQGARFVVLPIRQTIQPAGQSACLQAMACGKAVVFSDIAGVWDRNVLADGETCLLVQPGSAEGLREGVEKLLDDPGRAAEMGRRAREAVEKRCALDVMADALKKRLGALTTASWEDKDSP